KIAGGPPGGVGEPARSIAFKEVGDHFSVGLRPEAMTLRRQRFPQFTVVLDNAVVNDGKRFAAIEMRMRIDVRGSSMGRPTGVASCDSTRRAIAGDQPLERLESAGGLFHFQRLGADCCQTGRVISSIFKPAESVDHEGRGVAVADVPDYSTHEERGG